MEAMRNVENSRNGGGFLGGDVGNVALILGNEDL